MKFKKLKDQLFKKAQVIRKKILDRLNKKKREQARKRLIKILTIFFIGVIVLLILITPMAAYEFLYQDKIYAGVYIDGINFGGLTKQEAINKLNQYIDNLKLKGLNFYFRNQSYNVGLTVVSPEDPDLAFSILNFETEEMIDQAYQYGRSDSLAINIYQQLQTLLEQKEVGLKYNLNETELINILERKYHKYESPSLNAQVKFIDDQYEILPEKTGFVINYDLVIEELKSKLNLIALEAIQLKIKPSVPEVGRIEALQTRHLIDKALTKEKIVLKYEDKDWSIEKNKFKDWLAFVKKDNQVKLVFKQELFNNKLAQIAEEINIQPQDAKFKFTDGKVINFEPHESGLKLDQLASLAKINRQFFQENKTEINLIVKQAEPDIKTADVNDMGITEIIGVGESDFSGSSFNRVRNIKNAAKILHGYLIKPGEEFSLVEAIGEVNAATGFYPEYVIKGDRTIKEYGGGLCQIATTTFRVAMYTGLPITERKPHSYIVSYYNPIGFDAAIYGPHPDVRFINDTGNYILFQTDIEGTKLTFTFWGKSDGRQVEVTNPAVYNWRNPPAPKYIEKPDLEPGAKKIIEYSKKGADAHFYRYITRPGQKKEEEIWRSHYVAWPAIYEIGIEEKIEEAANGEAGEANQESQTNPETETTENNFE
jgi:vancomycin resistance protein YoaR